MGASAPLSLLAANLDCLAEMLLFAKLWPVGKVRDLRRLWGQGDEVVPVERFDISIAECVGQRCDLPAHSFEKAVAASMS